MADVSELRGAALAGIRWTAMSRVAAEVVVLGSSVVLARLLTPAEFGRAAVALIVVNVAAMLAIDSFGAVLVQRPVVEHRHRSATFALSIAGGVACALGTALFALTLAPRLFGGQIADLLLLASPGFVLAGLAVVSQADLQRSLNFKRLSTIEILALLSGTATALVLAAAGAGSEALVLAALATGVVSAAALVASSRPPRPRLRAGGLGDVVAFGGPMAVASLAGAGLRNIDKAILGAKLGAADVGFFWRAFNLAVDNQRKISGIAQRVAFPVYSRADGVEDLRRMRLRVTRCSATLIFPLLATLFVLAPVLIPAVYGEPWRPAVVPAQLLALGGLAATVVMGSTAPVMAVGHPRAVMRFNLGRFAVYTAAIWLTVPYGLRAVCVAVVCFQLASVVASARLLKRYVGIAYSAIAQEAGPALAATAVLVGVGLGVRGIVPAGPGELPVAALVAVTGLAAYCLTLRLLFPTAWREVAAVSARLLPVRLRRGGTAEAVATA